MSLDAVSSQDEPQNRRVYEYQRLTPGYTGKSSHADSDINPALRSNIPMGPILSAKHMLNSIYGVNYHVSDQTSVEKMIDIWKNGCQDPLSQKMTYSDLYQYCFSKK